MDHTLCTWSTGIHEGLTVGQGDIDFNGFWEIPCYECARNHERKYPEDGSIWPFEK